MSIDIKTKVVQQKLKCFRKSTDNEKKFIDCFQTNGDIKSQGKKWEKVLKTKISQNFKKIRIRQSANSFKNSEIEICLQKRRQLKMKLSSCKTIEEKITIEDEIEMQDDEIAEKLAQDHVNMIEEHVSGMSNFDGSFNNNKMWKLRKKIMPRLPEKITAKKSSDGLLVTNPALLRKLYLNVYQDRLSSKEISPRMLKLKGLREKLLQMRLKSCKEKVSPGWNMSHLDKVLANMKTGKTPDPSGFVNELFKLDNIGDDLKESVLILMNKIKHDMIFPEFMELTNIISIYKGKGD